MRVVGKVIIETETKESQNDWSRNHRLHLPRIFNSGNVLMEDFIGHQPWRDRGALTYSVPEAILAEIDSQCDSEELSFWDMKSQWFTDHMSKDHYLTCREYDAGPQQKPTY